MRHNEITGRIFIEPGKPLVIDRSKSEPRPD